MYSNKFAAKLVNIRQLCKKDMENLSIFMVLSTYYPTFRVAIKLEPCKKSTAKKPFIYRYLTKNMCCTNFRRSLKAEALRLVRFVC